MRNLSDPSQFWIYLAEQPLFFLVLTVLAYLVGDRISQATGRHPVANPVLIAVMIVGGVLLLTGTPHARYFEGARFVHVLLGPATVALALPIIRHRALIRRQWRAILGAMVIGAGVGVISAAGLAKALGLSAGTVASIAPKSVTAAIAMGISEQLGGTPPLTAVLVIATGILGAILITPLMN
ncbi:MAG: LrgB family protein, partial [Rhabdaerophilum sp.]